MQTLRFETLEPFLLSGDGNRIFKIPLGSDWIIVKNYRGSRSGFETIRKSLDGWIAGRTSYFPSTRCRVERECLGIWQTHGFATFHLLDDCEITAPGCVPGEFNVFRYESGPRLVDYLRDNAIEIETRLQTFRSFLEEWGRRHEAAASLREPRLLHENGDLKHLKVTPKGLVWFDFEIAYRTRSGIDGYISREIASYLKSLLRMLPAPLNEVFWKETLSHYPSRQKLREVRSYFFRNPDPIQRTGRWIDRTFLRNSRKRVSKYQVAERLAREAEPPSGPRPR